MEKEGINDIDIDMMFDLKPIVPEIYNSINGGFNPPAPSPPRLISFENSKNITPNTLDYSSTAAAEDFPEIINFSSDSDSRLGIRVSAATRSPSQAHHHLIAERRRRQNLSQLFINLSKVVPGIKKLDKGSLLEDGISYLQALQERVRVLEEEEIDTSRSDDVSNDHHSNGGIGIESGVPEIQARISEKHVMVKILCKKEKEMMSRIPGEMEKINLDVLDMRIMPFGGAALHITILAQMQSGFNGTVEDIVDHLHTNFMNQYHQRQPQSTTTNLILTADVVSTV